MRVTTSNMPSGKFIPMTAPMHLWTGAELRDECMTLEDSQMEIHQMIDDLFDRREVR